MEENRKENQNIGLADEELEKATGGSGRYYDIDAVVIRELHENPYPEGFGDYDVWDSCKKAGYRVYVIRIGDGLEYATGYGEPIEPGQRVGITFIRGYYVNDITCIL